MRILSWNVHSMRGTDGRHAPERIARVIEQIKPDVAGLQEVGGPLAPGAADGAEMLGRLTGMFSAFGPTMSFRDRPYGNAILARHPITATRNYDLSVRRREPRGCLRADVELAGVIVHVFAAHLGLHWRERRRQAAQLLSADILRDAALAHPLVLVGDFNTLTPRAAVPRWLRRQLVDCAISARNEAPTFPSRFPLLRLDHAYVDDAFRVLAVEVVRTPLTRRASDHLPLVVELELEPAAAHRPPAPRTVVAEGVTTSGAVVSDEPAAATGRPVR
jgi:endonuclease/exonuclease/phosphatase family metal-dependent hydrolase